ncbi:putative ATP-binding protein component of ABC transporter [Rhizobium freirei PRF 81]|uniref:Putative ATP-binding protein component of ABC transporter n=2 Tax=Rhizobium freirei TaxID=1353277 RepID=N6TX83_9HYPH|nr:putative ATP-binding protein component of ABC transporter [Rhizobium freirei PRF 81]
MRRSDPRPRSAVRRRRLCRRHSVCSLRHQRSAADDACRHCRRSHRRPGLWRRYLESAWIAATRAVDRPGLSIPRIRQQSVELDGRQRRIVGHFSRSAVRHFRIRSLRAYGLPLWRCAAVDRACAAALPRAFALRDALPRHPAGSFAHPRHGCLADSGADQDVYDFRCGCRYRWRAERDLDAGRRPRQPLLHAIGRGARHARAWRHRVAVRRTRRHADIHAVRGLRLRRQSLPLADDRRRFVDPRRSLRAEGHLRHGRRLCGSPQRGADMSAIFEVSNLKKAFGGLTVTNNVSLSMAPGDRVALIGPNGAGKTSFVNLVTGNLPADSGEVRIAGQNVNKVDAIGRVRRGLVRSFQVTRLFQDMTPAEHVGMAVLQRTGRSGRMFGNFLAMRDVMAETEELLGTLGLAALAHRKVSEIAYGQQRLLEIAVAMALKPKVLLLDEPAAGVPQSDTGRIEQALADLPADLAVLIIEHDMDLVFRFAKRVGVLAAGTIIFDGSPKDVTQDARVREAYLGSYANAGHAA